MPNIEPAITKAMNDAIAGEIVALTHVRHGVKALEDSVFLLTTVTSQVGGSHGDSPHEGHQD